MAKKFNFEDSLKRIEEINQILEKGDLPLEDSLKIYQEGVSIASKCQVVLKDAELKIEEVNKELLENTSLNDNEGN